VMGKALEALRQRPRSARGFAHSVMLGSVLGVLVSFMSNQLGAWLLVTWLLGYTAATLALELALQAGKRTLISGGDYRNVVSRLGQVETFIAGANSVDLMAGTLKTFTERRADIHSLHNRFRAGCTVRILVMNPNGDGVHAMANERQAQRSNIMPEDLSNEIRQSLKRLLLEFSPDELASILRFYRGNPHSSLQRFGGLYIITLYTFGRGGSSPAIAVSRSDNAEFCDLIDRGFSELWNSPTTVIIGNAELAALA
jgi:hypothetical protein